MYRDVLASDGAPEDALVPIGELSFLLACEGRNGVSASKKICFLHPNLSGTESMIAKKVNKAHVLTQFYAFSSQDLAYLLHPF